MQFNRFRNDCGSVSSLPQRLPRGVMRRVRQCGKRDHRNHVVIVERVRAAGSGLSDCRFTAASGEFASQRMGPAAHRPEGHDVQKCRTELTVIVSRCYGSRDLNPSYGASTPERPTLSLHVCQGTSRYLRYQTYMGQQCLSPQRLTGVQIRDRASEARPRESPQVC